MNASTTQLPDAPETSPSAPLTTGILAIGRVTPQGDGDARIGRMPAEIRETVRLHLKGYIGQWYSLTAEPGVAFILTLTDLDQARSLLGALPLASAGMMTFDLMPIGPLIPMRLLLQTS